MKKIGLIVILTALALLGIAATVFWGRITAAFNRSAAQDAAEAGDPERAAVLYERVLKRSPRDEELRLLVSRLYQEAGIVSRAEYVIWEGLQLSPSAELYGRLSGLYVASDKLADAVALLDGIPESTLRAEVLSRRPDPPEFSLPGGTYESRIEVSLQAGGEVYLSLTGQTPSVLSGQYIGPIAPEPGVTEVTAIAVNGDGFVSGWAESRYELVNIIDPILFEDSSVEKLIRDALGKPDELLFSDDLWAVEELTSSTPLSYTTLSDLAHCRELKKLDLTGDWSDCDLSALPSLQKLTDIRLTAFGIGTADLDTFAEMPWLVNLSLPANSIGSVTALSALPNLVTLDLSDNAILDVSPLGSLTSLTTLNVSRNALETITGIAPLVGLTELSAAENRLSDLLGAEGLTSLRRLDVSNNPGLEIIDAVVSLSGLERFVASRCGLRILPDLSGCESLSQLDLSFNELGSAELPGPPEAPEATVRLGGLEGLEGLKSLKYMSCENNLITSLEPLETCTSLLMLRASYNGLSSVEPLHAHPALEAIWVENNLLTTIAGLKTCPKLKEIHAYGNGITDPRGTFVGTGIEVAGLS
ncbi:MAG: leucine-rich repeat domain-containing protein [Oscillospiraceae bacterium]|jgi:Leucine-rich repeat (LRR) protein|nr:leucine-rich repeat domain-containing protein [Oscillospiraceae bacterium]